jgi:hypothetical protein
MEENFTNGLNGTVLYDSILWNCETLRTNWKCFVVVFTGMKKMGAQ